MAMVAQLLKVLVGMQRSERIVSRSPSLHVSTIRALGTQDCRWISNGRCWIPSERRGPRWIRSAREDARSGAVDKR